MLKIILLPKPKVKTKSRLKMTKIRQLSRITKWTTKNKTIVARWLKVTKKTTCSSNSNIKSRSREMMTWSRVAGQEPSLRRLMI